MAAGNEATADLGVMVSAAERDTEKRIVINNVKIEAFVFITVGKYSVFIFVSSSMYV